MSNLRTFYACQAVAIAPNIPDGTGGYNQSVPDNAYVFMHGVQSVGLNSSFDFENIFELGQLEIYDAVLNIPQIEITIEKVLDGWKTPYGHISSGLPLASASKHRANVRFNIYGDTANASNSNLLGTIQCTGMYVNSVTYTFPVDGNCTESLTLVGNHKQWYASGTIGETTIPSSITNGSGIPDDMPKYTGIAPYDTADGRLIRRQDVTYTGPGSDKAQTVTVTLNLNREDVFEFGKRIPYAKIATYPIEATTEVQSLVTSTGTNFDTVSFNENTVTLPVKDQTITVTAGSLTVNLGSKNFLTAINHTGGDAGGGNATVTRNFTSYNTFTVTDNGSI